MAESLQQLILDHLDTHGSLSDSRNITIPGSTTPATDADAQISILGALNSLLSREMIHYESHETLSHVLTPEGIQIALQGAGSPITPAALKKIIGDEAAKVGQGRAFKNGWIAKDGDGLVKAVSSIEDTTQRELREKSLADLRKRKLAAQKRGQWFTVHKGPNFSTSIAKPETDLTVDMLTSCVCPIFLLPEPFRLCPHSGAWKSAHFKKYNFEAEGIYPNGGALHPLLKVREEMRNIFLEMGFAEMPTSSFVESGFWCFDALFVPQQHPARELQDTFYLSDPVKSLSPPRDYYERISRVHEHGGYGSVGYRAPWSDAESHKLLLRTHTTASSAHMLYKLAARCRGETPKDGDVRVTPGRVECESSDGFRPAKLFSIDRVFRNETMDATHLAEFHQVEGVVADRGLTLADLIGFMRVFFKKMGIENIRFKPAYNPYTEPSLEIFAFHPMLDKWVEVGNSGMFRPEMLEPMGFPKDVHVHGWGISLERPTMIRYGINNIRTLVGHKVPIENVEKSPAVRF
ncbi:phenylalanine-tRNA ligase [Russula vinacea]|nr:phenylalanine-tRNA ligase [Russula vinacea]